MSPVNKWVYDMTTTSFNHSIKAYKQDNGKILHYNSCIASNSFLLCSSGSLSNISNHKIWTNKWGNKGLNINQIPANWKTKAIINCDREEKTKHKPLEILLT
ncbi:hypothetical protein ACJX0J_025130, partial [Zea mays]